MEVLQLATQIKGHKKDVDAVAKLLTEIARLDKERTQNLPKLKARLDKLYEHVGNLEQSAQVNRALRSWVDQYRQELVDVEETLKRRFGVELERELRKHDLVLSGQYPELKASLFTIELDFDALKCTIWYGPRQERLDQCRLSVGEVGKRLEKVKHQLGSGLDWDEFLAQLQRACSRVVGSQAGEPAPIVEVLAELAHLLQSPRFRQDPRREYYRSYSRADFSYDLFQFRETALLTESGRRLHLVVATRAHTKRRRDFLWVPDDETGRGTTYSHLQLKEETA